LQVERGQAFDDFQVSNNLSFFLDILVKIKVTVLCEIVGGNHQYGENCVVLEG
jgi:hypothetical protein